MFGIKAVLLLHVIPVAALSIVAFPILVKILSRLVVILVVHLIVVSVECA
jgi:hypothetical protein